MNWQYTFEIRDPFLAELLVFNLTLQLHVIKTSDLSVQVNILCVVLILCCWHLSNYVARKQYSLVSCLLSEEEIPLGQSLVRYCKYCCSSLLSILQLLDLEPQSPLSAFPQIRRPQSTWPFPACVHARLTGVTQRFVCLFSYQTTCSHKTLWLSVLRPDVWTLLRTAGIIGKWYHRCTFR